MSGSALDEIDFHDCLFLKDEFLNPRSLVEAILTTFLVENFFWHLSHDSGVTPLPSKDLVLLGFAKLAPLSDLLKKAITEDILLMTLTMSLFFYFFSSRISKPGIARWACILVFGSRSLRSMIDFSPWLVYEEQERRSVISAILFGLLASILSTKVAMLFKINSLWF